MDAITPSINATDLLNGTKCDATEITANLFKDHKMSIDNSKKQRLQTYLRIRSVPNISQSDRKCCYQSIDSNVLLVIPPKGSNASKFGSDSERKKFNFTKIFDERVDQSAIYDSCGLPVVKRFLSGQNGLLFAYGITSSGKSYTMRGTATNPGIIPRALKTVFDVIGHKIVREVPNLRPNTFNDCVVLSPEEQSIEEEIRTFIFQQNDKSLEMSSFRSQMSVINESSGNSVVWDDVLHSTFRTNESNIRYSIWISFYEIYNENIFDLLDLEIEGQKKQKILLLRDESENYYVKGLRQICVSSAEDAYKVLLFGQNNLHISSTDLNKNSSRSHCAFTISLISSLNNNYSRNSAFKLNHLSICDLAGAERSEKANNTGQRIKEAGKINGSLLSLSRCISTLRHNQKFEHDTSKQRLVNYRDSKLTKVFQPFLSGNGMAAMISTMNPLPNLFDETFFALKFTGVAAQVVVSTEDQRNKFHDSLKRLTQIWMQSSQRWSNFADIKSSKPSVSIIQTIKEEDEDSEEDNEGLDITVEDFERKVEELTQIDITCVDPQEIEVLRTQIDFLMEKLKATETDKFEMEVQVRRQVVSEFNKLIKDMEDMANDKDRAKKKLEEMMTQRLITTENIHKKEKLEFENKINCIENENFRINEQLCLVREERDKAIATLSQIVEQKDQIIKQLENKVIEYKEKLETKPKVNNLMDVSTSPIKPQFKDMSTSPLHLNLLDANTSTINLFESRDANTSTIDLFESRDVNTSTINLFELRDANSSAIDMTSVDNKQEVEFSDKGVGNSLPEHTDCETSTTNLIEMSDKNTFVSVDSNEKQTETDCLTPKITLVNKSVSMIAIETKDISTSPIVFTQTQHNDCSQTNKVMTNVEYKQLLDKMSAFEAQLKEKEAMIRYHQRQEHESIQKIQDLEKVNQSLENRLKTNPNKDYLFECLKNPNKYSNLLKPNSVLSSSISSFGTKQEDSQSLTSVEPLSEKPKKSGKYSTRKRKPNYEDIPYLDITMNETMTEEKSSQASSNSMDVTDDLAKEIYSTKKKNPSKDKSNRKIKRKANISAENEDLNKYCGSKRKRLPLKNLYSSPMSPIISGETRVTRSRAKKSIQF